MKYLVVKGWLGFGDRLESLKMAVSYALKYNLQIYVDWTDSIWSHGAESFYTYFKFVNMPVLNSLDDIPENATVFPEYWKDHMKEPITVELLNKSNDLNLNLGILDKEYPTDVVVFSTIGNRTLYDNSTFFANVFRVVDSRILNSVRERQQRYNLKSCMGIHIRGTDRVRNQTRRELSIQHLAINTMMYGGFSGKPMVCVSDDKDSYDIWKRFYPHCVLLSSVSLEHSSSKGNHNVKAEDLKISKDKMNVDMLVDFFTLGSCEKVLTTYKDSRFAKESIRLHPHVNTICGL
jgi:hypothetical protein